MPIIADILFYCSLSSTERLACSIWERSQKIKNLIKKEQSVLLIKYSVIPL